jgi:hypothetical protein
VIKPKEEPHKKDSSSESDDEQANMEMKAAAKRALQLQYLENENTNLVLENEDLNTTLKINKDIIKSLLAGEKGFEGQVELTFDKMSTEIDLLEQRVKTL